MNEETSDRGALLARQRYRLLQTPWYGYEELMQVRGDPDDTYTRTWMAHQLEPCSAFSVDGGAR